MKPWGRAVVLALLTGCAATPPPRRDFPKETLLLNASFTIVAEDMLDLVLACNAKVGDDRFVGRAVELTAAFDERGVVRTVVSGPPGVERRDAALEASPLFSCVTTKLRAELRLGPAVPRSRVFYGVRIDALPSARSPLGEPARVARARLTRDVEARCSALHPSPGLFLTAFKDGTQVLGKRWSGSEWDDATTRCVEAVLAAADVSKLVRSRSDVALTLLLFSPDRVLIDPSDATAR